MDIFFITVYLISGLVLYYLIKKQLLKDSKNESLLLIFLVCVIPVLNTMYAIVIISVLKSEDMDYRNPMTREM